MSGEYVHKVVSMEICFFGLRAVFCLGFSLEINTAYIYFLIRVQTPTLKVKGGALFENNFKKQQK